jgi:16S rRNA G527 N7-methylase RsmG
MPFAILRSDCQVTLVEPRAKRTAFLHAAVRSAACTNVLVKRARVEELGGSRYDVAASRATFPPSEWLALAQKLVKADGAVLVFTAQEMDGRGGSLFLRQRVAYETGKGSPRWLGVFVPRETQEH